MASIDDIKRSLMLCRDAGISPFIWGNHGVGKSSVVRQICEENNLGFIDCRCATMEASDLMGLPDRKDGKTVFLPPARMPSGTHTWKQMIDHLKKIADPNNKMSDEQFKEYLHSVNDNAPKQAGESDFEKSGKVKLTSEQSEQEEITKNLVKAAFVEYQPKLMRGILFLDELNRASNDVIQAAFQLVLDRAIGGYSMPTGWSVVVAGNYMEGNYITNNFNDPAFLSRFCHIELGSNETTLNNWISHMTDKYGEKTADIADFVSNNAEYLYGDRNKDSKTDNKLGFVVTPNPRSWEFVLKVEEALKDRDYGDQARFIVITGLIGSVYSRYKDHRCPVKPRELLGCSRESIVSKIKNLDRQQAMALIFGFCSFAKKEPKNKIYIDASLNFIKALATGKSSHKELAILLTQHLLESKLPGSVKSSLMTNKATARILAEYNDEKPDTFVGRMLVDEEIQKVLANLSWNNNDK